ncbi:hypothetical protein ACQKP0_14975 [Heyndrickxia sp. NPDC080065]|uniref:hypothetical protein n=1 Tax=Heyndrickxia sp. NPDC080065 TaxID=3390568 RepID=UPI003D03EFF1
MGKLLNFDYLNLNQQNIISEYLEFRKKGGVVSFNGFKAKKYISNIDVQLHLLKGQIGSMFFRIICGRCSIDSSKSHYEELTEDEKKRFNPDVFSHQDIKEEDYFYLDNKRSPSTLHSIYKEVKPFFYWILSKLDKEADIDKEKFEKFRTVQKNTISFLDQFPTNESEYPIHVEIKHKVKSFLTREQMIIVRDLLLNHIRSHNPLRDSCAWQLSCSTGIRPEELVNLRIEYFHIDEQGFIKINEKGWGILNLPASASKQGRSPSHPLYKTLVSNDTVAILNRYLKNLYSKQEKSVPRGKGYLFRPDINEIHLPYKTNFMKPIIRKIKTKLHFLDLDQRKDFELKAARRSMNNLIMGPRVKLNKSELDKDILEIAANYQMRHKPRLSISKKHYTEMISEDEFYEVLEHTIGFPWSTKSLNNWEIQYGYKNEDENTISKPHLVNSAIEKDIEISENTLNKIVLELNSQLEKLTSRPKSMTVKEWTVERNRLKKEIQKYNA